MKCLVRVSLMLALPCALLAAGVATAHAEPARPAQPAVETGPFADVPKGHWADVVVDGLERRGIFTGYPAGAFRGERALTRYEFAVALQRMLQEVQRQLSGIAGLRGTSRQDRLRYLVSIKY